MVRRNALFAIVSAFILLFSGGGIAWAAPPSAFGSLDLGSSGPGLPGQHGCSRELVDDDWRLGPVTLSNQAPVGPQVVGYKRTGDLSNSDFLIKWWNDKVSPKTWKWPPEDGYVLDGQGRPIKSEITLTPGTRMDRYGGETGTFLAPPGTPYAKRALPPANLGAADYPEYCNYHVYQVLKPFKVYTGRIAKAFEQPGGGTQYEMVAAFVPANPACESQVAPTASVRWLICSGYLQKTYPGPQ
ncbi:TNT domain-containing protein [Gordonia sp. NPDC003376]